MSDFHPTEISDSEPVAMVSQGLVLYIHSSLEASWEGLLGLWDWFVARTAGVRPLYGKTSTAIDWRRIGDYELGSVRAEIGRSRGKQPFWHIQIANHPDLPDISLEIFHFRGMLDSDRAGCIMLRLPIGWEPKLVLEAADLIGNSVAFWAGSAGYMFHGLEKEKELAFDQIWAWSRRYWGIEVVDVHAGSWDILQGIYGVNWLTMIGNEILNTKLSAVALLSNPRPGLELKALRHGIIVQAGPHPVFGDMNRFEDVSAYVAASRLLEPAFLQEPRDFMGMFTDHKSTLAWIRRFLEPEKWLEPEVV